MCGGSQAAGEVQPVPSVLWTGPQSVALLDPVLSLLSFWWSVRVLMRRRRSPSSCLTSPLFVAIYEVRRVYGVHSFAFIYISDVHARVHVLAPSSPSTPPTLTMKVFSLVSFTATLSVVHGALLADTRRLARQDSNNGIHLAVSPACGSLSGTTTDVNAGIDLKRVKTIVAFGVSSSPRVADIARPRLRLTLRFG